MLAMVCFFIVVQLLACRFGPQVRSPLTLPKCIIDEEGLVTHAASAVGQLRGIRSRDDEHNQC